MMEISIWYFAWKITGNTIIENTEWVLPDNHLMIINKVVTEVKINITSYISHFVWLSESYFTMYNK